MSFKSNIVIPIICGIAGSLLSMASGQSGEFLVFGNEINVHLANGLLVAGADALSEMTHEVILKHIPGNKKYAKMEGMGLKVVTSGGAVWLAYKFLDPDRLNATGNLIPFGIGAAGAVGGDYTYNAFFTK